MEARSAASSIKVRLVVTSGNVHPEEVSSFLGVAPSKTWLQGETVHPKATNVHKENGWVLSIEGRSGEWVAERIVDRLSAKVDALGRRGASATVVLHDGGHLDAGADRQPSVVATDRLIQRYMGVRRFVTADYLRWGS